MKFTSMIKTLARVHPHHSVPSTLLRAAVCLGWLAMALALRAEITNVPGALTHETDPRLPPKGPGWRLEKATITNTNLPRVLLIGDSILRGYSRMVVQSLQNKANVDLWLTPMWQSEQFNQALANVLAQGPYQVIHMNIGLHGWPAGRIKDEEYEPLTRAFLKVIRDKCPQAKLIWASTTPFLNKANLRELDPAINPILVRRNQIDARVMTEAGVPINDFYSLLVDKKEWNAGDGAHWKQPAYRLLAKVAANSILRELAAMPAREPTNAKEAAKQQQQKPGITPDLLGREAKRKAAMTPEQLAWEETLEANLGNFYLPFYYQDKDAGHETAWDYVKDDPALPRMLIIGDSISRGYTLTVRHALAGKVNVHRAPANCGPTASGLKNLDVWLGKGTWDVISWNFGIHDRRTAPAVYRKNLEALLKRLQATGAKLIWVRTTPAPPSATAPPSVKNAGEFSDAQCEQVNRIADALMESNHIPEVDLYALMEPKLKEYQLPNDVHFKESGYEVMGQEVARVILEQARKQ